MDIRGGVLRAAAVTMRHILVDQARARLAQKRGGRVGRAHTDELTEIQVELPLPAEDLVSIHEALGIFAEEDPVRAKLVELRVFAGLSHLSAAAALDISPATAARYWTMARLRLAKLLAD